VPDLERLRADPAGAMANMQPISLFYTHHKPPAYCVDIQNGFGYPSYAAMGQVIGYRSLKMAQATWPMSLSAMAVPLVALGTNSSPALQTVGAIAAAGGTFFAIKPWFRALAKEFPANDLAAHGREVAGAAHAPADAAGGVPHDNNGPDLEAGRELMAEQDAGEPVPAIVDTAPRDNNEPDLEAGDYVPDPTVHGNPPA
jgi:hypothetical protein